LPPELDDDVRFESRLYPPPSPLGWRILKAFIRQPRAGWPRPRAAIGDGDRGRALGIESWINLNASGAIQCEVDHIGHGFVLLWMIAAQRLAAAGSSD